MLEDKRREYEATHEAEQEARHTMRAVLYVLLAFAACVMSGVVAWMLSVGII